MYKNILHIIALAIFLASSVDVEAQKKGKKGEISYKDKQKFERLYIDASKAKMLSDLEQAAKLYEHCIKIDPSQPAPYFELGNIYMHLGRNDEAVEYASKAAELDPMNYYYRLLYAEILKNNQQFDAAIKEFEDIVEKFPTKVNTYLELSLLYVLKKDYESAIRVYDDLEKQVGPSEEIKLKKQYLYLQNGEVNKAAEEIESLIEMFPDNVQYYLLLAEIYNVNGMDDKALKQYKVAAEKFPNDASVHISFAEYYRTKGQFNKALDHLKIAFADPSLDVDEKVKTILSFFDLADRDKEFRKDLIELGEVLLKAHPENAPVLTINGDIQLNYGDPEKARNHYMKAVEIDASRYPIWSQLLILEADQQKFDTLAIHSQQAIDLFPNQPASYYFLGFAKSQLEEYEEAAEAYRQGVNLIIDNPPLQVQFYLGMGDSYNQAGRHDLSDDAFEKALKIDSNNTIALNNYSYYLSLREDKLERALYMSKRANDLEPNSATYLDTYAWILYKLERYEEANTYIQKALNNGGELSGEVLEHAGDILIKLGDSSGALKYWEKAKESGDASNEIEEKINSVAK